MEGSAKDITTLLGMLEEDSQAADRLFHLIRGRFHAIAQRKLRDERASHTLQSTALVDDAFRKLIAGANVTWRNREQFFAAAAKVMRQILVDHARKKAAAKRGGGQAAVRLDELAEPPADGWSDPARLVELNDVVESLEKRHPEPFQVFSLHYFMGYELKEISEDILAIPYTTAKRRWAEAKRLLYRELIGDE